MKNVQSDLKSCLKSWIGEPDSNIPAVWSVADVRSFLDNFDPEAQVVFVEQGQYLSPLHIICPEYSLTEHAAHSEGLPPVPYLYLHLKQPLIGTITAKAGRATSERKARSSKANGKKGGRPAK